MNTCHSCQREFDHQKRLFANALPEPDLKYRSSALAVCSSATATYDLRLHGRWARVDSTCPCSCDWRSFGRHPSPIKLSGLPPEARKGEGWRRGRDSNPRYPCEYAAFRVRCFQPLSHLSGGSRGLPAPSGAQELAMTLPLRKRAATLGVCRTVAALVRFIAVGPAVK